MELYLTIIKWLNHGLISLIVINHLNAKQSEVEYNRSSDCNIIP